MPIPHDGDVPPISVAIRETRKGLGLSQEAFGEPIDEKQQTIALWESGREPKLEDLRRLEVAHGLPLGHFVRAAGYCPTDVPVEDMILSDGRVDFERRSVLSKMYRDAVVSSATDRAEPNTLRRARS